MRHQICPYAYSSRTLSMFCLHHVFTCRRGICYVLLCSGIEIMWKWFVKYWVVYGNFSEPNVAFMSCLLRMKHSLACHAQDSHSKLSWRSPWNVLAWLQMLLLGSSRSAGWRPSANVIRSRLAHGASFSNWIIPTCTNTSHVLRLASSVSPMRISLSSSCYWTKLHKKDIHSFICLLRRSFRCTDLVHARGCA